MLINIQYPGICSVHNEPNLSYNMSYGFDMGGGIMNVNANTTAAVKTKWGLRLEGK